MEAGGKKHTRRPRITSNREGPVEVQSMAKGPDVIKELELMAKWPDVIEEGPVDITCRFMNEIPDLLAKVHYISSYIHLCSLFLKTDNIVSYLYSQTYFTFIKLVLSD